MVWLCSDLSCRGHWEQRIRPPPQKKKQKNKSTSKQEQILACPSPARVIEKKFWIRHQMAWQENCLDEFSNCCVRYNFTVAKEFVRFNKTQLWALFYRCWRIPPKWVPWFGLFFFFLRVTVPLGCGVVRVAQIYSTPKNILLRLQLVINECTMAGFCRPWREALRSQFLCMCAYAQTRAVGGEHNSTTSLRATTVLARALQYVL